MKFKFSLSPNYNAPVDTKQIMRDLAIALVFVSICSIVLQFSLYGAPGAIRAVLIFVVAILGCYITDLAYWKIRKLSQKEMKGKIEESVPAITAIILALTMPLGDFNSYIILYVTFIAAVVAELFGKLIYGGFGYNIFNPAGVGRAFALLAFGKFLVIPTIDGLAAASPLTTLQGADGLTKVYDTFANYTSLFIGTHQGTIGETVIIPIIIAAIFLIVRNVIDWVLPVVSLLTVAILASITSMMNGGLDLGFVLIHMFSGGLVFGAVFMLTDPVTNPLNRQGKMIFAIIFSLLTFLIRSFASLPEGVVFSILIVNMFVPAIDRFTANVTNVDVNKKVISVLVTLAIAIIMTVLFNLV